MHFESGEHRDAVQNAFEDMELPCKCEPQLATKYMASPEQAVGDPTKTDTTHCGPTTPEQQLPQRSSLHTPALEALRLRLLPLAEVVLSIEVVACHNTG